MAYTSPKHNLTPRPCCAITRSQDTLAVSDAGTCGANCEVGARMTDIPTASAHSENPDLASFPCSSFATQQQHLRQAKTKTSLDSYPFPLYNYGAFARWKLRRLRVFVRGIRRGVRGGEGDRGTTETCKAAGITYYYCTFSWDLTAFWFPYSYHLQDNRPCRCSPRMLALSLRQSFFHEGHRPCFVLVKSLGRHATVVLYSNAVVVRVQQQYNNSTVVLIVHCLISYLHSSVLSTFILYYLFL